MIWEEHHPQEIAIRPMVAALRTEMQSLGMTVVEVRWSRYANPARKQRQVPQELGSHKGTNSTA